MKIQQGEPGSFHWDRPADTHFAWRFGYYTDTDRPDAWAVQIANGATWGPRETEILRQSMTVPA